MWYILSLYSHIFSCCNCTGISYWFYSKWHVSFIIIAPHNTYYNNLKQAVYLCHQNQCVQPSLLWISNNNNNNTHTGTDNAQISHHLLFTQCRVDKDSDYDHLSLIENKGQNIDANGVDSEIKRSVHTRRNSLDVFVLEGKY